MSAHEDFANAWAAAVQWACLRYGERDRMPRRHKAYLRNRSVDLGLWRLLEKQRVRALLSLTEKSLRTSEWTIPWWLDDAGALARARHVLKLNHRHGWYAWVMAHRPASCVLHIVRHPGGVLQSWRKRWLQTHDPELVRRQCSARLAQVAELSPQWAERFGDLEHMPAAEAELWYWRYSTEFIHQAGAERRGYKHLLYERLVADPVRELRAAYEFCGLSWEPEIERAVDPRGDGTESGSRWYERVSADAGAARDWREHASSEDHALIARILDGSSMAGWWRDFA